MGFVDLITTIPGISTGVADVIIAETGADMTRFPTAGHLASWAGTCPGSNESAGRIKSTHTRPGNPYLKGAQRPGLPERATHDYVRHGTTTLFAALEVATGKVTDACYPRHRHQEFLTFLKVVAKAYPRVKLHVVADNYATHKHPAVKAWLAKNPRITLHFTPTSGSWLNIVEIFFNIITRQAIRRGTFTSVKDLITAIETYIDGWNERCEPFVWTKTADEILAKAHRKKTSNTRH